MKNSVPPPEIFGPGFTGTVLGPRSSVRWVLEKWKNWNTNNCGRRKGWDLPTFLSQRTTSWRSSSWNFFSVTFGDCGYVCDKLITFTAVAPYHNFGREYTGKSVNHEDWACGSHRRQYHPKHSESCMRFGHHHHISVSYHNHWTDVSFRNQLQCHSRGQMWPQERF